MECYFALGNDAAIALAEHVSGSVEAFCELMNEKAKQIGAMNTHFITPHGLDNEGHYSTAYDLALLADYALNIPYLANIFQKKSATIFINGSPRNIFTTNEMLSVYEKADGVKTGFTNGAGRCLVTSATNDEGWQLISVVLGCDTKNQRTQDSKKLLDYGFENYQLVDIAKVLPKKFVFRVEKSLDGLYQVEINDSFIYPLRKEEKEKLHYAKVFSCQNTKEENLLVAPVLQGTKLAQYAIYIGENKILEVNVILDTPIVRKGVKDYWQELLKRYAQELQFFE